jgi:hypothetical protein
MTSHNGEAVRDPLGIASIPRVTSWPHFPAALEMGAVVLPGFSKWMSLTPKHATPYLLLPQRLEEKAKSQCPRCAPEFQVPLSGTSQQGPWWQM